jgi:hypothetical protein
LNAADWLRLDFFIDFNPPITHFAPFRRVEPARSEPKPPSEALAYEPTACSASVHGKRLGDGTGGGYTLRKVRHFPKQGTH